MRERFCPQNFVCGDQSHFVPFPGELMIKITMIIVSYGLDYVHICLYTQENIDDIADFVFDEGTSRICI